MEGNLRILIVDDHAVIRDGIRLICDQMPDVDLVGEASSIDEAERTIESTRPDVVLLDLHLRPGSGIELLRRAKDRWPDVRTVVLTVEHDEDLVVEAMRHGAAGFVTKETALPAIIEAAKRAAEGETVIEGLSTGRLLERFASFASEANRSAELLAQLSPREREVLRLLADGQSNQQIGSSLGISGRTAATHVASIYRKLQVTNRVDAAREAIRLGLIGGS